MSALFDAIRRADHNGRQRPIEGDEWSAAYDAATPAARRAMALGARRRAEQLAASAEPDPEPEPDAKASFHAKNSVLLNRITGRQAPTPNTKD